uniref:Uncharacterized protein n=1 Tax=Leersia perrieri TaxID=77586 RepID=A0A0D9WCJ3_9ORYZ
MSREKGLSGDSLTIYFGTGLFHSFISSHLPLPLILGQKSELHSCRFQDSRASACSLSTPVGDRLYAGGRFAGQEYPCESRFVTVTTFVISFPLLAVTGGLVRHVRRPYVVRAYIKASYTSYHRYVVCCVARSRLIYISVCAYVCALWSLSVIYVSC